MDQFLLHSDAAKDLEDIKISGDIHSHGVLLAFVQQAKVDANILDHLSEDFYGEDNTAAFSVRRLVEQGQKGRDLWRIKVFDVKGIVAPYRIAYAIFPDINFPDKKIYAALAIIARSLNYDETTPRFKQLIATYYRLAKRFGS